MKIFFGIAFFSALVSPAFAQSPPSEQAIITAAGQLLGTSAEQDSAVTLLIQAGIPSVPYFAQLLNAKEPDVKAAAWRVVNGVGFDATASFYIAQLSSSSSAPRAQATKTLTALTNKYFGNCETEDTAKRTAIIAKWNAWLVSYRANNPQ